MFDRLGVRIFMFMIHSLSLLFAVCLLLVLCCSRCAYYLFFVVRGVPITCSFVIYYFSIVLLFLTLFVLAANCLSYITIRIGL